MNPAWRRLAFVVPPLVALAGCAVPIAPLIPAQPRSDPLLTPDQVTPGRLEYAPDSSTFAPILTERFPYPTQAEANATYLRLLATEPVDRAYPASIWLFGCKPGALDDETARVARYRGPVVHCATDFLDSGGRREKRATANFYYSAHVWRMQPVYPPLTAVPWRNRERSPKDFWWWVPGRPRYE
jgi:hypothetical protein